MKAPNYFNEIEKRIWKEVLRNSPCKLLPSDSPALEVLVSLVAKQRQRIELTSNERTSLLKLFDDFRMTSKAKEKTKQLPVEPNNAFDEI